jgi:flagellin FlaB
VSGTTAENLVFKNATTDGGKTLDDTTQWDGNSGLNNSTDSTPEYTAYALEDDGDTSYPVLNSQADRFEIVINTTLVEDNGEGLSTGDSVELDITSRDGGSTQVIYTMPQQLAGEEDDSPVPL